MLGAITDTNATYLAQRLAALGIDCYFVSQVGDNRARISEVLRRGLGRSDLVITTGGLGPTDDDLTREAISDVLGESPRVDRSLEEHLMSLYARRGVPMPEANRKQATLIPSARALRNPVGTAPGWLVQHPTALRTGHIIAMPGVPFEMKRMWEQEVEPWLRSLSDTALISRTLKTLGLGESSIQEMLGDLMSSADPTLAPYAKSDGVYLRISTKASTQEAAAAKIAPVEAEVRRRLGPAIYGTDADTPGSVIGELLSQRGVPFTLLEVGPLTFGALGPTLGAHELCQGTLGVADLTRLSRLAGAARTDGDIKAAALSLARDGTRIVCAATAAVEHVEGGALKLDAEALVILDGTERVATGRLSWRTAPTEVARLSGLTALNLLRTELMRDRV